MRYSRTIICVAILIGLLGSFAARADSPATLPSTPVGSFDVIDWAIFISDAAQSQINEQNIFNSTLPDFMDSRRNVAPPSKRSSPQPIGLIRFQGDSGGDKVDVLLRFPGSSKVMANWPKAQSRSQGLLWQNLIVTQTAPASLPQIDAFPWCNDLRSVASPFLLKNGNGEKFLLYDAELGEHPSLQVQAGSAADQFILTNTGKEPLHDILFYKKESDGWRTGSVDVLRPPPKQASTAPTTHTSKPATQAATSPSTHPADISVALSTSGNADPAAILSPWKQKLAAAGLPDTDEKLIFAILQKYALDEHRLTAIYMLSADQMDQLVPLEVTPQPRKTVRVGLVIVRNIDPAISREVEDLVAQLDDDNWAKRKAAQQALEKMGKVAKPKLQKLRAQAKSPEAIYRLDQIIQAADVPAPASDDNSSDRKL